METSRNAKVFHSLRSLGYPAAECLTCVIDLQWRSIRNLAGFLGISHTHLRNIIRTGRMSDELRRRLTGALGFDPWGAR